MKKPKLIGGIGLVGLALAVGFAVFHLMTGEGSVAQQRGMGCCCPMMGRIIPEAVDEKDLPGYGSREAKLYLKACAQCHSTPSPKRYSRQEWKTIFDRMDRRMEMCMMARSMNEEEKRIILKYLMDNAFEQIEERRLSSLNSDEAGVFKEVCSRCHALPDPKQHSPGEWVEIVDRMREHQRAEGKPSMSQEVKEKIFKFLREYPSTQ
ncbi:MAG: hypothetical protein ACE5OR_13810 [bacterium]